MLRTALQKSHHLGRDQDNSIAANAVYRGGVETRSIQSDGLAIGALMLVEVVTSLTIADGVAPRDRARSRSRSRHF